MKVMYVTVGAPGSGKTHMIDTSPLKELDNIHSDRVRDLVEGFVTKADNETGNVFKVHDTAYEKKTWSIIWGLVEQRMEEGKTFCFDSTFLSKNSFSNLRKLREKYGYRVYLLDFTQMSLETLSAQNKSSQRVENSAVVPDNVILDMHQRAKKINFPSWTNTIDCVDYKEGFNTIIKSLEWKATNVDEYDKVKIIGDIHGCASVLKENVLKDVDPNTLYIFLGDYLDRGIENAKTFKMLIEHLDDKNFVFLRGNHDRHLERYLQGLPINNQGTRNITIPALLEKGITKRDIKHFTKKLQDVFVFDYNNRTYVCTHAGLNKQYTDDVTHGMGVLLDSSIFVDGVGKFNFDVDYWYNNEITLYLDTIQFHGHRNTFNTKIDDYSTIYNLEQAVERGGNLAVAEVTSQGIETHLYKNEIFDVQYLETNLDTDISTLSNQKVKNILDNSKNILTKEVEDNLFANNFTREVFSKGDFNNFSVQARGLFTDNEGEVRARGFKKFFNLNQTPETKEKEVLTHPLPCRISEKIDGFLVIVTGINGQLKVLSKGGDKSFGNEGKRILMKTTDKNESVLARYLEDKHLSVTCEVVSTRDSHVIEYDESSITVLDAIYNNYSEVASFEEAQKFADFSGLSLVDSMTVYRQDMLDGIIQEVKTSMDKNKEGVVLTFSDGFRVKIKSHYYLQMKYLLNEISKKRKNSYYSFHPRGEITDQEINWMKEILNRVHFGDDYKKTGLGFEDKKETKRLYNINPDEIPEG